MPRWGWKEVGTFRMFPGTQHGEEVGEDSEGPEHWAGQVHRHESHVVTLAEGDRALQSCSAPIYLLTQVTVPERESLCQTR